MVRSFPNLVDSLDLSCLVDDSLYRVWASAGSLPTFFPMWSKIFSQEHGNNTYALSNSTISWSDTDMILFFLMIMVGSERKIHIPVKNIVFNKYFFTHNCLNISVSNSRPGRVKTRAAGFRIKKNMNYPFQNFYVY